MHFKLTIDGDTIKMILTAGDIKIKHDTGISVFSSLAEALGYVCQNNIKYDKVTIGNKDYTKEFKNEVFKWSGGKKNG